nr:hypothetical protein [Tanacetum cinerariifolium]
MDENNQIIPIATGVCQGERKPRKGQNRIKPDKKGSVKENQEKDKIRSNRTKREAWRSREVSKQSQSRKKEKLKEIQVEGPEMQNPTSFIRRKKKTRVDLQFP